MYQKFKEITAKPFTKLLQICIMREGTLYGSLCPHSEHPDIHSVTEGYGDETDFFHPADHGTAGSADAVDVDSRIG